MINNEPEKKLFQSGHENCYENAICLKELFQSDVPEQKAAQLLYKYDLIDNFDQILLLVHHTNEKVGNLMISITGSKKHYDLIESQGLEKRIAAAQNDPKKLGELVTLLNKELYSARWQAIKYMTDYAKDIFSWQQLKFHVDNINKAERADNPGIRNTAYNNNIEPIRRLSIHRDDVRVKKAIEFMKADQFLINRLSPLFRLYDLYDEPQTGTEDTRFEFLKLFHRDWGHHAEDVLIFKILQNLERYNCIPETIEIYGDEDPCFQCQVKLQWLADNLASMIIEARERNGSPLPPEQLAQRKKLKILY